MNTLNSMRVITVDNGNTNPHVGIYENQKFLKIIPLKEYIPNKTDFIIVSDVGSPLPFRASFDLKSVRHLNANKQFFNMPVFYGESLGDDRLISSHFIFQNIKANELVLLIDAGTFMTLDFISEKGFLGGYIFPGINTFLSSYQKGSQLKILSLQKDFKIEGFPHSTDEAILAAADSYLDSALENIIKKYSPSKIIVTGGSLELIKDKVLKINSLKVQFETIPHLIHLSLFSIYQNHLLPKDL